MTGKSLYDQHVRALKTTERFRWNHQRDTYDRVYPSYPVLAWEFLPDDQRRTWDALANLLFQARKSRW